MISSTGYLSLLIGIIHLYDGIPSKSVRFVALAYWRIWLGSILSKYTFQFLKGREVQQLNILESLQAGGVR